jgi:hypothetical protein
MYTKGSKGENRPQSPKTEFGAQNKYIRVIHPSIRNFTWSNKKYTSGVQEAFRAQKRNLGPKINMVVWRGGLAI